jgi:hypothetical protein
MSTIQLYIDMLFSKYKKTSLTRKELAEVLCIGLTTLENLLMNDQLPIRYKRMGVSQKARYAFPIVEVAHYLAFEEHAA